MTSLDNSKRLYELSGWDDTNEFYQLVPHNLKFSEPYVIRYPLYKAQRIIKRYRYKWIIEPKLDEDNMWSPKSCYPAYTLEYLLERLPKQLPYGAGTAAAVWFNVKTGKWTTGYSQHIAGTDSNFKNKFFEADNPTDAAALLCIKLFEQKILVKEQV